MIIGGAGRAAAGMKRCTTRPGSLPPGSRALLLWGILAIVLLPLPGVAAAAAQPCSCSVYMPGQPAPTWAYTESVSDGLYRSQGIVECTGIQSLDFREADTVARTNLSRMVAARVESEILLIETYSNGTGQRGKGSTMGRVTSRQSTKNLLERSTIYDHWVDRDACTVHSAVQVTQRDVDATIRKQRDIFNAQLRNQELMIVTQGLYGDAIYRGLAQMLSEAGVNGLVSTRNENTWLFKAKMTDSELHNRGKLVRVSIGLNIEAPDGRTFWSRQLDGKGLSFGAADRRRLTRMAIRNACEDAITPLHKVLHSSVK